MGTAATLHSAHKQEVQSSEDKPEISSPQEDLMLRLTEIKQRAHCPHAMHFTNQPD
jgi:hypothetical protein